MIEIKFVGSKFAEFATKAVFGVLFGLLVFAFVGIVLTGIGVI